MAVRELWRLKKLTSKSYPITGAVAASGPTNVPVELTQYAQEDVFDRICVRAHGNVIVAGAGPGTATGAPNPHGLLNKLTFQTSPQYNGVIPFNNVSARSLLTDASLARGFFLNTTEAPIPDVAGTYAIDFWLEMYFKRPKVRKGIQWALYLQKYTSALLNMNWGGREQLFTGGTNTWDLSGLQLDIYADSDLAVQADTIHASEVFEQTYVIAAAQADFPIDTLPPGYIYTDFVFQSEVAGALSDAVINNINIEGGGRVWLPQGDGNGPAVKHLYTAPEYNDQTQDITGLYALPLRDGMFTRGIDALKAPITIKLDVNAPGSSRLIRLLVRRMVPGAVQRMAAPQPKVTRPNIGGH